MENVYTIRPENKINTEYAIKPKNGYVNKDQKNLYTYRELIIGENKINE